MKMSADQNDPHSLQYNQASGFHIPDMY